MDTAPLIAHRRRGLHGHDFKTTARKPSGIAACACANIQGDPFIRGKQVCQPGIQAFWIERFVLNSKVLRVAVVPGNRCLQFVQKRKNVIWKLWT
jgi:hypothetical protein